MIGGEGDRGGGVAMDGGATTGAVATGVGLARRVRCLF